MVRVDLKGPNAYPPLEDKSPQELFDFAVHISQTLDHIQVSTPADEKNEASVVLDSRLMRKKGVQVF